MFQDRQDAGRQLAASLTKYKNNKSAIVIALPRGGVVVGYEVAKSLNLPLDVICPRKIGAPYNPEFAIGAVTETGQPIFNWDVIAELGIPKDYLDQEAKKEAQQSQRRLSLFRKNLPPRNLKGKIVIIVDDGLATGATMHAAIKSARFEGAETIVLAVPVSPIDTLSRIQSEVDEAVCLDTPPFFHAIGQFYEEFYQVEDEEVLKLLAKHK